MLTSLVYSSYQAMISGTKQLQNICLDCKILKVIANSLVTEHFYKPESRQLSEIPFKTIYSRLCKSEFIVISCAACRLNKSPLL